MRYITLFIVAVLGGLFIYFGENSLKLGDSTLPPIGKFINPYYGFWANADPINPIGHSTRNIPGLEGKAEVHFDENLVPHIYAESTLDMVRVQGYIHASQRLWQMDMISRAAGGRLAEVVGPGALNHDKYQRKLGMAYAAENALKGVKEHPETLKYAQAYCDGANTYISQLKKKDYPIEFKLLNYSPSSWELIDMMMLFKQLSYDLCIHNRDLESTYTRKFMGAEAYDSLFVIADYVDPVIPSQPEWQSTIRHVIPDSVIYQPDFRKFDDFVAPEFDSDNGSNNWAVSGVKTATGSPMLASDPHLTMRLPSIWFENHLHSADMNTYGVSFPGMFAILIGFNDAIAWGETNVGHDVAEWRKLNWKGDDFSTYILDGKEHKTSLRTEKIAVKGEDDVEVNIYITEAGIVSYTEDKDDPRYGLAFDWLAHRYNPDDELSTFIELNKAQNIDEYRAAIRNFTTPAQNFAFASASGDIALTVQGKFPLKDDRSGEFIEIISESGQLYDSFVPNELIPRQINPERNYVASANQVSTSEDYPFYYNSVTFRHFRNRYINSVLDTTDNLTAKNFEELQMNDYSKEAEYALNTFIPILEEVNLDGEQSRMKDLLKNWNKEFNKDAQEPILYTYFMDKLMSNAWDEWEQPGYDEILRYPSIYNTIWIIEHGVNLSFMLNKVDGSSYTGIEDLLKSSFAEAVTTFAEAIKENPEYKWSDEKGTVINHMAGIPAFSTKVLNSGGHYSALNAQKADHGPSWRMVVSMETPVKAYGIYPGGQSGNPGSYYYDNMVDDWVEGRYHEISFPRNPADLQNKVKTWTFQGK